MIRAPIILRGPMQRQLVASYILDAAPDNCVVTFKGQTRSLEQNARLWAMLQDISEQVVWYGAKLTPDDWKDVFTASLRKARVVPTIDGDGFVPLGMRTSQMSKAEFSALMELIDAFAAEKAVAFKDAPVPAERYG